MGELPTPTLPGSQADGTVVYTISQASGELRQGEVLSNVPQTYLNQQSIAPSTNPPDRPIVDFLVHPLAVVVTQDCDLEQDFKLRELGKGSSLPNVLLCSIFEAARQEQTMREKKSEDLWRRILHNQDPRYQYLRGIPRSVDLRGEGLPAMVVDFKGYFTVRTEELYERLKLDTMRRCRLNGAYAFHFAHRFHAYQSRVAIDLEHHR